MPGRLAAEPGRLDGPASVGAGTTCRPPLPMVRLLGECSYRPLTTGQPLKALCSAAALAAAAVRCKGQPLKLMQRRGQLGANCLRHHARVEACARCSREARGQYSRGAQAQLAERCSLRCNLRCRAFLADLSKERHCSLQPTPSEAWEVSVHI